MSGIEFALAFAIGAVFWVIVLVVSWATVVEIGDAIRNRRRICAHAREYGVTWLWFESTATIRRRVSAMIGLTGSSNPIKPALLAIPGVCHVSFELDGPGRVTATINVALWAKMRPFLRRDIGDAIDRTRPSMVTVRTVIR